MRWGDVVHLKTLRLRLEEHAPIEDTRDNEYAAVNGMITPSPALVCCARDVRE